MDRKIITKNKEETNKLGHAFAKKLKRGDVVLLFGELGAGKTTFTQAVARGLGIKDRILSPTFVLHRLHIVKNSEIKNFNHIDLYRLENEHDIKSLGFEEIVSDKESIAFIEWADKLTGFIPQKGYEIHFKRLVYEQREIIIRSING